MLVVFLLLVLVLTTLPVLLQNLHLLLKVFSHRIINLASSDACNYRLRNNFSHRSHHRHNFLDIFLSLLLFVLSNDHIL